MIPGRLVGASGLPQMMECEDRRLLEQWISQWHDLVDFEVHPVLSSEEVQAKLAGRL